ncbi:breast cancer type 2 susceptibility protein isoform X2 [Rhinoderma darwinii]|uniref:breast cancer type 2 susceptibility protein isoform X2 n=1 Tax=Rhinoderma darwinii TaxID=43563 RepID=UPI003F668C7E
MASVQPGTTVFFQLFQAHCSHADLGQMNVNWFENLTREALRLQPRLRDDDDDDEEQIGGYQDNHLFRTPQHKPPHYSQLESTPTIFKEQRFCSPLFLSPTKVKTRVTEENLRNVNKTQQSPDGTAVPESLVFDTSNRYLADSPVVMKEFFKTPFGDIKYLRRTPQQDRKLDISDSLLGTPQLIRNQNSRCISESLGVETDPEMSWSSSLATPPSPTLIIDQAEEVSKPRIFDKEDVVIVRSLFSKMNKGSEAVSSAPPPDGKIDSDRTKFESITFESKENVKSSAYLKAQQKKAVLSAVGDEKACQVVENAIEGMEDVLSIFFTNEKTELRKVKVDRRIKRKNKPFSDVTGKNDALVENTEEPNTLLDLENHNINSKILQRKTCSREISSSYDWTPLNLPDTTQEENLAVKIGGCGDRNMMESSTCSDSLLHRDNGASQGPNETNTNNPESAYQNKEHKEKSEEGLPPSSSSAPDVPWKSSRIAHQKPKPILSTLKKHPKFLYSLNMDFQQPEATGKIGSLDLQNAAAAYSLPEVKLVIAEDSDHFKDDSLDFQEIEDNFMNMRQVGPIEPTTTSSVTSIINTPAVSSICGDSTKLQVADLASISQLEVNVSESVTNDLEREQESQENLLIARNNCDSFTYTRQNNICTTPHAAKMKSKSINATCSDLLIGTNMQTLEGFKTASNKYIYISEKNLRKGEFLLKEDEDPSILSPAEIEKGDRKNPLILVANTDTTMTASHKEIIVTERASAKESILLKDIEREIDQNASKKCKTNHCDQTISNMKPEQGDLDINMTINALRNLDVEKINEETQPPITSSSCKQPSSEGQLTGDFNVQSFKEISARTLIVTPTKISMGNVQGLSKGIESKLYDFFTESQKTEIHELSSILENAGSQFDFTQVNKLNIPGLDHENMQKISSDSQKLNTSDVWNDVDFNDSFAAGEGNRESNVTRVPSSSESKSNAATNACDVADYRSVFKHSDGAAGGFILASGKSVNITDEDLVKAIEMFSDLEEKVEKRTKTTPDLNSLSKNQTFNVLQVTADRNARLPEASDIVQTTALSHAQAKEEYFSGAGLSSKPHNCRSAENHAPIIQTTEMEDSERGLEAERGQKCDTTSKNDENRDSASCLSTMPVGFVTGKGNFIDIKKASLDKATTLFNDILDTAALCEDVKARTVHEPSNLGLETNAHPASTTFAGKVTHGPTFDRPPVVFCKESTAPKIISYGRPPKPKQILHALRNEVNKESYIPQQNNSISSMSLFNTASGKPLQLSEKGLRSAHKMFAEIDDGPLGDQQVTGIVLSESKLNSGSLNDLQKESETTFDFPQQDFSTVNSKMIDDSHKFLKKAPESIADLGEANVVSDVGQRNLSSESKSGVRDPSVSLDHKIISCVTEIGKNQPGVNRITAGLNSKESPDIRAFENISSDEMSNKSYSSKSEIGNSSKTIFSTGDQFMQPSDALKKAQGMSADLENCLYADQEKLGSSVNQNEGRNVKCTLPPLGFSTASGKSVAVSKSSLQKAKQMFVDTEARDTFLSNKMPTRNLDALEPNQRAQSRAAEVNKRKPSLHPRTNPYLEKVLDKELDNRMCFPPQEIYNRKMAFFSTAKGNPVHLSSKALQKAREMFGDLNGEQVENQSLQGSVSAGSIMKENKGMTDLCITSRDLDNVHAASGDPVTISHNSLQKTKLLFVDTDNSPDTASGSQGTTATKRNQNEGCGGSSADGMCRANKKNSVTANLYSVDGNESQIDTTKPEGKDGSIPKMPCFSTAGGKSVTVSEESLKRAQEIFSEIGSGCLSQRSSLDIHPNPKSTTAVKVSLRENLKGRVAEASEKKYSTNVPTQNSLGFNTASGKQVCVSEDALQKVKGFFEECNTSKNGKDNFNENLESVKMSAPNPLLNTQRFTDSVTKLGRLQKNTAEGNGGEQNTLTRSSDFPIRGVAKHSTPLYGPGTTNLYLTSHTPENDFEIEAAESAKAFQDDEDLTDAEIRTDVLFSCLDKLPNVRNGKRLRSEDGTPRGEPPIKRQLLPEFDRSLQNEPKAALKPLTSSPHESLKDRRKYFYNVSLQSLSSDPASFSKGKKDVLESRHTHPTHLRSKLNISRSSLPASSTHVLAVHRNEPDNLYRTVTNSFVIPFNKKLLVSSGDQMVTSPRPDQNTDLPSESCIEVGKLQKDKSGKDFSDLVPNICCARDLQDMRIRKKQRQKIKPQPGSLYRQKNSSTNRINLITAVEGRQPTVYTEAQLYRCGVIKNNIGINSEKARTFEFYCLDYFTREPFLSDGGVQIADGGWLIPTDKCTTGRETFYRALCDTPGVDPKLISPQWVYNHYRWIVWKLAAMEVMFPMIFAGRCLTPDRVLLQLKYRYDVEIDKCRRSAVRKIMERDDTPAKTLVLCISKILTLGIGETNDAKQATAVIEVTDGWYGIKALLDPALTYLLKKGRMFIGQKIMVHGAELVGSDDACTPLEAPESLMLKIAGNSTRPARWYVGLGYFPDPRPFCLRLSSLLPEGGIVGCVDVLIQRIYPMQWMVKMANGTYVFRNERAEEREAEKHSAKQQKSLEVLFVNIQEEYEKQEAVAVKKRPRRQSLTEPQIRSLQDGAELYEALQNEPDPSYLESCLSSDQLRALNHYRQSVNDKRHAQIQAEFRKAIESSEQEAGSCTRRDVTPVWKIRIVDYKGRDFTSAYTLNIWRPLHDVVSLLKEGSRFKIYQLAASQSKGKSDTSAVQLTATKKTQFQQLQPLQHVLQQIYTERQETEFSRLLEPHFTAAYGEVDVVGLVISTQQKPGAAPLVYLSDESCNVVALKFYTDLGQLALEELTRPYNFIAAANLRWRSEYLSGVPVVFAGDLASIAANPKEIHLQKAIQKLRQSIQSVPEFCKEMENKLQILQTQNPQERASFSRSSVDPRARVPAGSRCSTPLPKINNPQMKFCLSTPDGNTVLSTSIDTDKKTCKKTRGLDYLSRIPSPDPLTPMRTFPSPSLQTVFRPPRSLHKEDGTGGKLRLNTVSSTPSKLEGGFVADEELAMINTQILVSGLEKGRKMTTERETAASDNQRERSPSVGGPASEETQRTEEVSEVPYQRRLCRKRKQKL